MLLILPECIAQDVITHRDLVIDLGNGLKTDAQLTLPVVGKGPFPGVLLIQGSGTIDMNEYLPPTVTGSSEPSRPFLQIAEYLSSRGFAVLRFNKRGVGLNDTVLNSSVINNTTYQDFKNDSEKALKSLEAQPEVNRSDITVLGHSEGAIVAPRLALENKEVKKMVLMAASAENLRDLIRFQLVNRTLLYAEQIMDTDHDDQLSIKEVEATIGRPGEMLAPIQAAGLIEKNNTTGQYQWQSIVGMNRTGNISIEKDLKPLAIKQFELITTSKQIPGYKWLQSYFALNNTIDVIGNVSASILILNGENDTQVPVENALLLEQKLTEINHPDHTLIVYPGLGHTFYPSKNWIQPLGPIEENVLADMYSWLASPERKVSPQRYSSEESINKSMNRTFDYDVFISYSSKDKQKVIALAERLRKDGLKVWLDRWVIQPGDSIPLKLQYGLEQSRTLVMCMSPAYLTSEWGTLEHYTVLFRDPTNSQRRIIPLLIEDCTLPDVFAQFLYIDWRTPSNESYDRLLAACRDGGVAEEAKPVAG